MSQCETGSSREGEDIVVFEEQSLTEFFEQFAELIETVLGTSYETILKAKERYQVQLAVLLCLFAMETADAQVDEMAVIRTIHWKQRKELVDAIPMWQQSGAKYEASVQDNMTLRDILRDNRWVVTVFEKYKAEVAELKTTKGTTTATERKEIAQRLVKKYQSETEETPSTKNPPPAQINETSLLDPGPDFPAEDKNTNAEEPEKRETVDHTFLHTTREFLNESNWNLLDPNLQISFENPEIQLGLRFMTAREAVEFSKKENKDLIPSAIILTDGKPPKTKRPIYDEEPPNRLALQQNPRPQKLGQHAADKTTIYTIQKEGNCPMALTTKGHWIINSHIFQITGGIGSGAAWARETNDQNQAPAEFINQKITSIEFVVLEGDIKLTFIDNQTGERTIIDRRLTDAQVEKGKAVIQLLQQIYPIKTIVFSHPPADDPLVIKHFSIHDDFEDWEKRLDQLSLLLGIPEQEIRENFGKEHRWPKPENKEQDIAQIEEIALELAYCEIQIQANAGSSTVKNLKERRTYLREVLETYESEFGNEELSLLFQKIDFQSLSQSFLPVLENRIRNGISPTPGTLLTTTIPEHPFPDFVWELMGNNHKLIETIDPVTQTITLSSAAGPTSLLKTFPTCMHFHLQDADQPIKLYLDGQQIIYHPRHKNFYFVKGGYAGISTGSELSWADPYNLLSSASFDFEATPDTLETQLEALYNPELKNKTAEIEHMYTILKNPYADIRKYVPRFHENEFLRIRLAHLSPESKRVFILEGKNPPELITQNPEYLLPIDTKYIASVSGDSITLSNEVTGLSLKEIITNHRIRELMGRGGLVQITLDKDRQVYWDEGRETFCDNSGSEIFLSPGTVVSYSGNIEALKSSDPLQVFTRTQQFRYGDPQEQIPYSIRESAEYNWDSSTLTWQACTDRENEYLQKCFASEIEEIEQVVEERDCTRFGQMQDDGTSSYTTGVNLGETHMIVDGQEDLPGLLHTAYLLTKTETGWFFYKSSVGLGYGYTDGNQKSATPKGIFKLTTSVVSWPGHRIKERRPRPIQEYAKRNLCDTKISVSSCLIQGETVKGQAITDTNWKYPIHGAGPECGIEDGTRSSRGCRIFGAKNSYLAESLRREAVSKDREMLQLVTDKPKNRPKIQNEEPELEVTLNEQ